MLNVNRNCLRLSTAGLRTGIARHLFTALANSMYTGIAGSCKQQGLIQELPEICIPQLHIQCIPDLLAFENSRADYRNYQTSVDRNWILNVFRNCWHLWTAGLITGIIRHCIPQLHTQCMKELLAFVHSKAEHRNYQTPVYRNCILNVCRNCLHL